MPVSDSNRTAPYRISQYHPAASAFCGPSLGTPHRPHFSGRELDRENDDEGRRYGRVHGGNRNDLDEWAGERHTDFLSPPEINRDWKTISLPTESAEFAVLF
jgi:hypothetical protein